ncbi:FAD-dependent oxidoreductase [Paenibacillus sp. TRM 82003]|nr:FAD-dependent oxidoreductase [Paenibacillus sp. TRM 82003]
MNATEQPLAGLVVLGGGAAGLGAAYTAQQFGERAPIYEARERAGGLLDFFTIGEGYRFDHAVHLSFTKDPEARSIFDRTPYHTHHPTPYNYEDGVWLKHPVQNNLYPLSAEEKVEAIESFLARPPLRDGDTYRDWLISQYGRFVADRYPIRYTRKYWTVDAERLTTDWIGRRMYRPKLKEVLRGAFTSETENVYYAPEMRYPKKGGYRAFLDPLLSRCRVLTGKKAILIEAKRKRVEFADGSSVFYDKLISSLPLPVVVGLLDDVPHDVRHAATGLWATSAALVSVGLRTPHRAPSLWFYIYDEAIAAARVYSPSWKSADNAPEGASSLQFEIYFSRHKPLGMDRDTLVEHVLAAMERMGVADRSDVVATDAREIPYANVAFDEGMAERRTKVREYLSSIGISTVGRFGEWDYLWSDQSLMSGRREVVRLSGWKDKYEEM